jgi:hypothetical protein
MPAARYVERTCSAVGALPMLITDFDLPREAILTRWLNEAKVWESLARTYADDSDDPQPRQNDGHRPPGLRPADVVGARNKLNVSGFVTYTDSETWAGNVHPAQALRQYRSELVGDAKAVVVGVTSNGFTLADPNDRGVLDIGWLRHERPGSNRGLCPQRLVNADEREIARPHPI